MAKRWEEIESGRFKLTVSPDGGGSASVFYGTRDEILDKLADAQANANGRSLPEVKGGPNGSNHVAASSAIQPVPLSPSERMQTVADLANPAKVDLAVTRVVESVIGPLDTLREERESSAAVKAVEVFISQTPDWYPSEHNKSTLVRYMQTQGMDPTKAENYLRAYADLAGAQLLQRTPSAPQNNDVVDEVGLHRRNAENPAPKTPTRYSTGVRQSDVSGTAPMPGKRLKYTREQIANLSAVRYKELMLHDPEFSRCVEFYERPREKRKIAV